MANDKVEKFSLTGDVVFADLMDKVLHHLYLKDLCRVARVCKSWNAAVKRELEHRGMQSISLYENRSNLHTLYRFKVKPCIALLFTTREEFTSDSIFSFPTASFEFIKKYVETTVQVGSSRLYTEESFNTDHDKYDQDECVNYLNPYKIPCLIIPKHDKLNVKFVWYSRNNLNKKSVNHRTAMNLLIPKEKDTKTFLLLFTFGLEKPFLKKSVNYLRERFQGKSYALWGNEMYFPPIINDPKNGTPDFDQCIIGLVGISISSTNMDVFSTVFSCENMKISTFYQDLLKFKENVKLRQHSMAFINGPWYEDYYCDTSDEEGEKQFRKELDEFYSEDYEQEFLYNFKKVFPEVPFISTFHNSIYANFAHDTTGSNGFLMHTEDVTIAIVTFN